MRKRWILIAETKSKMFFLKYVCPYIVFYVVSGLTGLMLGKFCLFEYNAETKNLDIGKHWYKEGIFVKAGQIFSGLTKDLVGKQPIMGQKDQFNEEINHLHLNLQFIFVSEIEIMFFNFRDHILELYAMFQFEPQ